MTDKKKTHWGMTGTRAGATPRQEDTVYQMLSRMRPDWMHHGCAVGADQQIHKIAKGLGIKVHGYPVGPTDPEVLGQLDALSPSGDPLLRNHWIVDATSILIAIPRTHQEEQRSGTWATIRYARRKGHIILFVWPDGEFETHHYTKSTADQHIPEEEA